MNKWQEEVWASLLDSEEQALSDLEKEYRQALNDIGNQIKLFQSDIDQLNQAINAGGISDTDKEILISQARSKAYQKEFQEALQGQINGILDQLHSKEYNTIDSYLHDCYEESYVGEFYNLSRQGLPYIAPINQSAATHAILTDSKVVRGYYSRLGVDTDHLKKVISQEVTRGIATAASYAEIARNINNASRSGLYNAQRIARTEGHRIQNTASRDAANNAVAHGADLVKQWDSTLDGRTRESHVAVDGEIKELDERFSNGLDRPGDPSGAAEEVINCRCAEIHKPRWATKETVDPVTGEVILLPVDGFVKMDNFTGELRQFETPEDYTQFKEWYFSKENTEYMAYVAQLEDKYGTKNFESLLGQMSAREYEHFKKLEDASPMFDTEKQKEYNKPEEPDNRIIFREASTISEAEAFARDECGIPTVSYKGIDLEVANAMNESLANAVNYSDRVLEKVQFYGSAQERNKLYKQDLSDYFYRLFKKQGYPESVCEKYSKSYASKVVGKVSGTTYAFAASGELTGAGVTDELLAIANKYAGVCVNSSFGKDFDAFTASVARDVATGWHPIGCDTVQAVFDHEFGHILDYAFGLSTDQGIVDAFNDLDGSRRGSTVGNAVSRYADKNIAEFIAESYSEFLNNTSPRETAKFIGQIIERYKSQ